MFRLRWLKQLSVSRTYVVFPILFFIDIVNCASNPCNNDATCVEVADGYKCVCQAGFTGPNCEIDEDECVSSPCATGATCVNKVCGIPSNSYPRATVAYIVGELRLLEKVYQSKLF